MEVEKIERQQHYQHHHQQQQTPSKLSRVGNNRNDSTKLGHHYGDNNQQENGIDLIKRPNYSNAIAGGNGSNDGNNINSISSIDNRLCGWHHSSRIIRVSRASGGKDRHSKVWTSKGLRDRRVRLSVTTALQFYDLQDRLGYDQPSKAVEWLIKAAADSIAELPSLKGSFPLETDDQKRREQLEAPLDSGEADVDNFEQEETNRQGQQQQQQQHGSLSKSACSSTSETSKGSGLSLSRGDTRVNRVKARERARERTAKDKEKEKESGHNKVNNSVQQQQHQYQNVSHMSQNSTFTELLTAGISNSNHHSGSCGNGSPNAGSSEATLFHRAAADAVAAARQWPLNPMNNYFGGSGMLGGAPATVGRAGFPGQVQLGNSLPHGMTMSMLVPQQPTPFSISIGGDNNNNNSHHHHHQHHHQLEQLQHFPFVPDLILPMAAMAGGGSGGGDGGQGGDYDLNFTISSSSSLAAGFNRGTLQSNSSSSTSSPRNSLLTHLQRFSSASANAAASSPMDGSTNNVPFFIGTSATTTTAMEHHHNYHHHHQFQPGLQVFYGDGRHSDHKSKGR